MELARRREIAKPVDSNCQYFTAETTARSGNSGDLRWHATTRAPGLDRVVAGLEVRGELRGDAAWVGT